MQVSLEELGYLLQSVPGGISIAARKQLEDICDTAAQASSLEVVSHIHAWEIWSANVGKGKLCGPLLELGFYF